jgi:hypothetical protein
VWKKNTESCRTLSEQQVKNGGFGRGCRWFQLFSVISFSNQNHSCFRQPQQSNQNHISYTEGNKFYDDYYKMSYSLVAATKKTQQTKMERLKHLLGNSCLERVRLESQRSI